jgi:hypothetical protein
LQVTCNNIVQYVATVDNQAGGPHIGDLWSTDESTKNVVSKWNAYFCGGNLCQGGTLQMLTCQRELTHAFNCWEADKSFGASSDAADAKGSKTDTTAAIAVGASALVVGAVALVALFSHRRNAQKHQELEEVSNPASNEEDGGDLNGRCSSTASL